MKISFIVLEGGIFPLRPERLQTSLQRSLDGGKYNGPLERAVWSWQEISRLEVLPTGVEYLGFRSLWQLYDLWYLFDNNGRQIARSGILTNFRTVQIALNIGLDLHWFIRIPAPGE